MRNWKSLINSPEFSWSIKTKDLINRNSVLTPFQLSNCIFSLSESAYSEYLEYVEFILSIEHGDSVGEFGCGNGANLLHFKNKYNSVVFGADISIELIECAKRIFPEFRDNFTTDSLYGFGHKSIDYIISNSVFQYIPSHNDANDIIESLKSVARKGVLITDLKNADFEQKFKETQARRQGLTMDKFLLKYKNTPHLFFDRSRFTNTFDMPKNYPDSEFGSFSVYFDLR